MHIFTILKYILNISELLYNFVRKTFPGIYKKKKLELNIVIINKHR